ncbi:MAG: NAD-dependent epimerase/dehydratase family protein, partial [Halobacteriota archaeon]
MTVFLTGATGVLGRRLVTDLVGRGHELYGLCRDEAGERLVAVRGGIPRRGDVLEPASLSGAMPPAETLIHAATAIPTATRPRRGDWELNNRVREQGLTNLIAADDGHLERVVFPSIV